MTAEVLVVFVAAGEDDGVRSLARAARDARLTVHTGLRQLGTILEAATDRTGRQVGPHPPKRGCSGGPAKGTHARDEAPPPTLLDAARGNWLEALYVLAVTTGMRQGELLGLGWEDVDLEARVVRVRRTLTLAKGGPRLTEPKTPKSRRQVRLTSGAVEVPKRYRERQEGERTNVGGKWNDQGLVFRTRRGTPIRRDNLHAKHWKPLLRRAGQPDIRFHELRHTCATLPLTKGVHPKVVSEMLGHSSLAITLDTYSHVIPGSGDAAARAMEDALP